MINSGYITLVEAADRIGVTVDTLFNWQKQGILKIESGVAGSFMLESDFITLQTALADGNLDKLNKRANKKFALDSFIPSNLAIGEPTVEAVGALIRLADSQDLSATGLLLGTAFNLLKKSGLVRFKQDNDQIISCLIKNPFINEIISSWPDNYSHELFKKLLPQILNIEIPDCPDFLGVLYQSLQISSQKSHLGIYYTPLKLAQEMAVNSIVTGDRVLDPCCGSGQFLLACAEFIPPENIWGCDIDRLAVFIARLNLIMRFPDKQFAPQIYCINAFTEAESLLPSDFNLVIGNPPWGCHYSAAEKEMLGKKYPEILSNESFSYFIEMAMSHLKSDGKLNFLLPEAFLNTARHADIRKKLLHSCSLTRVRELGKVFDGVTSLVINAEICKHHNPEQLTELISRDQQSSFVLQSELPSSADLIIAVNQSSEDRALLKKIADKPAQTLKGQADWALGIVTGNNQLFLSPDKKENFEPVVTGKNIKPFIISDAENYLMLELDKLQQVAPLELYRAEEKLIYRFIADRPVIAYDNQQRLTLNSANILIPKVADYPQIIIMALFNSELYTYLYRKKFFSRKILRSHLEELPLPIMSDAEKNELFFWTTNYLLSEDPEYLAEINQFVFQLYNLNELEVELVKRTQVKS